MQAPINKLQMQTLRGLHLSWHWFIQVNPFLLILLLNVVLLVNKTVNAKLCTACSAAQYLLNTKPQQQIDTTCSRDSLTSTV